MSFSGSMTMIGSAKDELRRTLEANKQGLALGIRYWWKTFMPGHFTVEGGKKYGYKPRKGDNTPPTVISKSTKKGYAGRTVRNNAYSWQKRRRFRHNKPLVFTGQSERMAKSQIRITTIRRKTGEVVARGAMNVPAYFYKYRKDLNQPDKYNELIRTTPAEEQVLLRVVNAKISHYLRTTPQTIRKIRVTGRAA